MQPYHVDISRKLLYFAGSELKGRKVLPDKPTSFCFEKPCPSYRKSIGSSEMARTIPTRPSFVVDWFPIPSRSSCSKVSQASSFSRSRRMNAPASVVSCGLINLLRANVSLLSSKSKLSFLAMLKTHCKSPL